MSTSTTRKAKAKTLGGQGELTPNAAPKELDREHDHQTLPNLTEKARQTEAPRKKLEKEQALPVGA